jgi:hypothetical protein
MAAPAQWSLAYARQAAADFDLFQTLERVGGEYGVRECHKLQLLQMACEKLVKAHLCGEGTDPAALQTSHAYVAANLPRILRQAAVSINFGGRAARSALQHTKHLAQEIEILAPAVKRGGVRPDNCEYPWEDASGGLHLPLDWRFAPSDLLVARAGRSFLKLVRTAIDNLLS